MCKIGTFQRNLSTIFSKLLDIYLFSELFQKVEIVMLRWNILLYLTKMLRQYFSCNERLERFLTCFCNILCYVGFFRTDGREKVYNLIFIWITVCTFRYVPLRTKRWFRKWYAISRYENYEMMQKKNLSTSDNLLTLKVEQITQIEKKLLKNHLSNY